VDFPVEFANLCCRTERWNFKIHWILHPVDFQNPLEFFSSGLNLKIFETERNAGISNSTGWLHPVEFDEIPLARFLLGHSNS